MIAQHLTAGCAAGCGCTHGRSRCRRDFIGWSVRRAGRHPCSSRSHITRSGASRFQCASRYSGSSGLVQRPRLCAADRTHSCSDVAVVGHLLAHRALRLTWYSGGRQKADSAQGNQLRGRRRYCRHCECSLSGLRLLLLFLHCCRCCHCRRPRRCCWKLRLSFGHVLSHAARCPA